MFTRKFALEKAEEIVHKLKPHVEVIHIAGSIRREKPEVKDIEICAVAKKEIVGQPDLFGETKTERRISTGFLVAVAALGTKYKGLPSGRYMQIELPSKIKLDLFLPQEVDYFRQFAIRTGSSDYVRTTMTAAWIRKGWRGTENGLRLESECKGTPLPENKMKWECIATPATLPPVWTSEQLFFEWLGLEYIRPKFRIL
jgi:DNA polymerase/3'-5' exonuclease PolX